MDRLRDSQRKKVYTNALNLNIDPSVIGRSKKLAQGEGMKECL